MKTLVFASLVLFALSALAQDPAPVKTGTDTETTTQPAPSEDVKPKAE